jgi:uncharacterized protein YceH (UPF0502 family)
MTPLSLLETRVLGVLVEKQHTVPDTYPLTLLALTAGCNQKSSRDPVLSASENGCASRARPPEVAVVRRRVERRAARCVTHTTRSACWRSRRKRSPSWPC